MAAHAPGAVARASASPDYRNTREQLTTLVRAEMRRGRIQGLGLALADADETVFAEGFGRGRGPHRGPGPLRSGDGRVLSEGGAEHLELLALLFERSRR